MEFEVISPDGRIVMGCKEISCVPTEHQLKDMYKYGYKFKLDGKSISVKKITEFISEERKGK